MRLYIWLFYEYFVSLCASFTICGSVICLNLDTFRDGAMLFNYFISFSIFVHAGNQLIL